MENQNQDPVHRKLRLELAQPVNRALGVWLPPGHRRVDLDE